MMGYNTTTDSIGVEADTWGALEDHTTLNLASSLKHKLL